MVTSNLIPVQAYHIHILKIKLIMTILMSNPRHGVVHHPKAFQVDI